MKQKEVAEKAGKLEGGKQRTEKPAGWTTNIPVCLFPPSIFYHPCLLCQTNDCMSCFSRVGCGGVLLSILVYSGLTNPESEGQVSWLWTIYKHTIYKEKEGRDGINQWRGYPLVKEHRVPGSKTKVTKEKGVKVSGQVIGSFWQSSTTPCHTF